jgi:hypothetical protein
LLSPIFGGTLAMVCLTSARMLGGSSDSGASSVLLGSVLCGWLCCGWLCCGSGWGSGLAMPKSVM